MDDLTEKNFKMLQVAFNDMDKRFNTTKDQIEGLQRTVTMMQNQVNELTNQINIFRVMAGGTGPTVRS